MAADPLQITVKRCLQRYRFFDCSTPLVVAVSTGVDSMVLLDLLQRVTAKQRIVVAHVNHHLRKQSVQEEEYLRQYCEKHQLQLYVDQWVHHPEHGIETAARNERYQFFAKVVQRVGASLLLTAHHENDLAETMLMKLVRTGDLQELIGIKESRPFHEAQIIRPLLAVPKSQLIQYAEHHGIRWFEDATNQEDDTFRNRVRHHYLPALQQENPQLLDHMYRLHSELGELLDFQQEEADAHAKTVFTEDGLKLREYQKCVPVLRRWLLRKWLNQHHWYNVSLLELKQADHWLMNQQKPTGEYQVGTAVQLIKNYSNVQLQKVRKSAKKNVKITDFMVEFDHWYTDTNGDCFGVFSQPVGKVQAKVWLTDNQLPLRVRTWRPNDEVRLKNGHHQKVRRILIDQKVPQSMRPLQLVVVDHQDQVLWVVNRKTAWLDRRTIRDQNYQEWYFCQKRDTGENDE